jgi:predicted  nucleic acid-binding Zn-ribbon protein
MIKQLEKEIRDLQKELTEVQKGQTALRLQPCRGDSEIREKDGKLEELDRRAKTIRETIRDLERKRQKLMAESTMRGNSCS